MFGLSYIRRIMRARPTFLEAALRVSLAVAIPTLLRWLVIDDLGTPFVLYFPAILLIAVAVGWRAGLTTAIGSCVVGVYMFWPAQFLFVGRQQVALIAMYALSAGTMVAIGQVLRDAILAMDGQARQMEDFNRELQHRTKNSIQMMRALASQASKATDPADFYATLGGRLAALAKANELLRFGALEACEIDELMRAAIAPFAATQIAFAGPPCRIARNGCTPLMMALHELGTNASKYGALSVPEGRVKIGWSVDGDEPIELTWSESDGPPVNGTPTRKGIGARLLAANGDMTEVDVQYRPDGVVCTLRIEQG